MKWRITHIWQIQYHDSAVVTFSACDVTKRLQMSTIQTYNTTDSVFNDMQQHLIHAYIWRPRKKAAQQQQRQGLRMKNTITFINLRTFLLLINYRYPLNNT